MRLGARSSLSRSNSPTRFECVFATSLFETKLKNEVCRGVLRLAHARAEISYEKYTPG